MKDIHRMVFRMEKFLMIFLFGIVMNFDMSQPRFWLGIFMVSLILNKFEDSIRKEYDDTTMDRMEKLMKEELGE